MNIYTHWLVTIGTGPVRGTKFTPIILVQKSYYSTALLRKVVAEKVDKLNTLLLSPEAPSTALFNELANPGALRRTTDLWLSDVRLAVRVLDHDLGDDEEAIAWTLFGSRLAPAWQGPADGVIPKETPVTIRRIGSASKYEIIDP